MWPKLNLLIWFSTKTCLITINVENSCATLCICGNSFIYLFIFDDDDDDDDE